MKTFIGADGRRIRKRKEDPYLRIVFWGTILMEIVTFVVFVVASGVMA